MASRNRAASPADGTGSPSGVAGRRPGFGQRSSAARFFLFAFAFAVMGDPLSSVAYAMEAGLRSLGGRLALLLPTMVVVLAIIVLVAVNHHQLYARFPDAAHPRPRAVAHQPGGLAKTDPKIAELVGRRQQPAEPGGIVQEVRPPLFTVVKTRQLCRSFNTMPSSLASTAK
jgi:hypothetical protein